jgi:OmpA-OmpF porin, OOP family
MNTKLILSLLTSCMLCVVNAQVADPNQVAKDAASNQANSDMTNAANKGVNKIEQGVGSLFKKKNKDNKQDTTSTVPSNNKTTTKSGAASPSSSQITEPSSIKVYQNYDFIAGEKIIFTDNFQDDQDGEFPSHWKLQKGQAIINKVDGKPTLMLTDGNYAVVYPRMKTEKYLTSNFTLEFDFIFKPDKDGNIGVGPGIEFYYADVNASEDHMRVEFNQNDVSIGDLDKSFPEELVNGFNSKWHHAALIQKNGQMKAYVDQFRICVNPNIDQKFYRLEFASIGSETTPVVITNVKLAEGGGMNVIGQKFTDAKIVTHGINFDFDKASIKPESMGTLNMIVQLLKDNPAIKFEVDGHTDNSGTTAHNLSLSQLRADAVKTQLVTMGVDASRLTTKGFGDTKPLGDNSTPEGKANNRRVEFVKM